MALLMVWRKGVFKAYVGPSGSMSALCRRARCSNFMRHVRYNGELKRMAQGVHSHIFLGSPQDLLRETKC